MVYRIRVVAAVVLAGCLGVTSLSLSARRDAGGAHPCTRVAWVARVDGSASGAGPRGPRRDAAPLRSQCRAGRGRRPLPGARGRLRRRAHVAWRGAVAHGAARTRLDGVRRGGARACAGRRGAEPAAGRDRAAGGPRQLLPRQRPDEMADRCRDVCARALRAGLPGHRPGLLRQPGRVAVPTSTSRRAAIRRGSVSVSRAPTRSHSTPRATSRLASPAARCGSASRSRIRMSRAPGARSRATSCSTARPCGSRSAPTTRAVSWSSILHSPTRRGSAGPAKRGSSMCRSMATATSSSPATRRRPRDFQRPQEPRP